MSGEASKPEAEEMEQETQEAEPEIAAPEPEPRMIEPETTATEPEPRMIEPEIRAKEHYEPRSSSFLPAFFSGIAVLLAAAALAFTLHGQHKSSSESVQDIKMQTLTMKLEQIENRIGGMESQLAGNKVDAAHMQLNRILFELKQLSPQMDAATRHKIDQAYQILKPLSTPVVEGKVEMGATGQATPETGATEEKKPSAPATQPATTPEHSSGQSQNSAPAAGATTATQPSAGTASPSGTSDNAGSANSGSSQGSSSSNQEQQDAPDSGTATSL